MLVLSVVRFGWVWVFRSVWFAMRIFFVYSFIGERERDGGIWGNGEQIDWELSGADRDFWVIGIGDLIIDSNTSFFLLFRFPSAFF